MDIVALQEKVMIDAAMSSCYDRAENILEAGLETRHLW
jgi:hypothetical protein